MKPKDFKELKLSDQKKKEGLLRAIIKELDNLIVEDKGWKEVEIKIDLRVGMYSFILDGIKG